MNPATNNWRQKTKKMSNTEPTEKTGMNSCAREGYAVPVSYKTHTVLLIYTGKSCKSLRSNVALFENITVLGTSSIITYG